MDVKKESPDISNAELLIVGSGTNGDKPGKEIIFYLENLNTVTVKQATFFSTCAGDASKTLATMKKIVKNKGYTLIDCFICFGKFALIKRGHPTDEELNQAKEFARRLRTPK